MFVCHSSFILLASGTSGTRAMVASAGKWLYLEGAMSQDFPGEVCATSDPVRYSLTYKPSL